MRLSSIGLEDHLIDSDNVDIARVELQFKNKINSILNKIDIEYNKIKSALGGYTYTFLEGSGCNSCVGGSNRDEYFYAFNHSSKKRFY